MNQVRLDISIIKSVLLPYLYAVPSDPVQNVAVTNVTDNTIAVMISWDPPSDPNGFIRYYRVEFQLILDGGCGDDPSDSEVMNSFANYSGTSEAPTMITLTGLGQ